MNSEKKCRKLSLSYLKDTLVRKNKGTSDSSDDYNRLQTSTAALDLARSPGSVSHRNSALKVFRRPVVSSSSRTLACGDESSSSDTESWNQLKSHATCDKSVSFIKTLRKRFQLKSNAEPIFKIKFNTRPPTSCKNIKISNSSHEIYNDRALCPLPPRLSEASCSTTHESPVEEVQTNTNGYESCENPKAASLTCQLLNLSKCGWYWGPISREEAEMKLTDEPDGAFLVRDSSADRYLLSLSFRSYGRTLHTRIDHSFGLFSFYSYPEHDGFGSIVELIHNSMHFSQSGAFCYSRPRSPGHPSFPVRLTKPISRFSHVRSLQYLCRFVIRQKITVDNIGKLPLPTSIKGYLEEGHY